MLFVALPLALLVLVAAAVGAYAWVRSQWYVGAAAHQVAIYQGVDGTVAGFHLRSVRERTGLALRDLPSFERDRVNDDIAAASLNDARRIVAGLRSVACADYLASARPTPTPSRRPTRSGRHRRSVPRPSATPTAAASRTTPPGSPCGKVP
jgi:protein phosphatase